MQILLSTSQTWFLYIGIVVATISLIGLIFFLTCGLRSKREKDLKKEHVVVDEVFMNTLIEGIGQLANIECISIDNGRLKFKVSDLDLVKADLLKDLSTSGVFITGSNVKLLFKYDSKVILEELTKLGVKQC